ncbi:MAG TPA: cytochrome c maturation protein CcmE [Gaiellaceae bacterium]|nr:cytochrome c maturation protein CcmE [Gaiellaceae bacterium]
MARKRSPARLVIALSVAAALAVFLLYASIAGGGTPMIQPSELNGRTSAVTLAGHVVGVPKGDSYADGLRFQVRDIKGGKTERVTVVYTGSVPDQFRTGRDIVVDGRLQNGVFVAERDSLITKCPSKYADHPSTSS